VRGEYSIRKSNQYNIDGSLSWVNINFSGLANSPIEYDMLDGLKNGRNILWSILFTKRVGKNIDLTINYDGRKPGSNDAIHLGRAQLKATF
jgi:hypothetical protein